ncbi:hypothetical protein [Demequina soli]|uniref:hypothetical protein n=1 Tax=Demequina soli TaxID=1638987 RepID=UPI000784A0C8|nr:hypothetical protein [Demequina soli]
MLNSRYAPVIALAVLGIVLVAVLGWFLAIKPQFDERDSLKSQTATIRGNIDQVNMASAKIDEYAAQLQGDDSVAKEIALNAPSELDLPAFRARLWKAFNDTKIELVSYSQGGETLLPPLEVDPSALVASQVAALFQTGPVSAASSVVPDPAATAAATGTDGAADPTAVVGTDGWAPAVTAPTESTLASAQVFKVPFTLVVAGSPQETYDFLAFMSDPDQPVFEVEAITQTARPSGSGTIPGVSDAKDGDVSTTITGSLFVYNPTLELHDQELGKGAKTPGESAFHKPPNSPAQPGA